MVHAGCKLMVVFCTYIGFVQFVDAKDADDSQPLFNIQRIVFVTPLGKAGVKIKQAQHTSYYPESVVQ